MNYTNQETLDLLTVDTSETIDAVPFVDPNLANGTSSKNYS